MHCQPLSSANAVAAISTGVNLPQGTWAVASQLVRACGGEVGKNQRGESMCIWGVVMMVMMMMG